MPACIQNPVIENVGSDRAFSVLMQIKAQDWAPEHYAKSLGHKVLETC